MGPFKSGDETYTFKNYSKAVNTAIKRPPIQKANSKTWICFGFLFKSVTHKLNANDITALSPLNAAPQQTLLLFKTLVSLLTWGCRSEIIGEVEEEVRVRFAIKCIIQGINLHLHVAVGTGGGN